MVRSRRIFLLATRVAAAGALCATLVCAGPAGAQMSERAILQALTPMMNDPDFDEKLEDFADDHDLDPAMVRALMARQRGMGTRPSQQQQLKQQQQKPPQQKPPED